MQRFLDVLQQPKLATFGAKSNANANATASLDVLLNWKSHYHLDAFFECILSRTRGESPRLERRDSKSKSKLESKMELEMELEMESKALGIVWYSQLIIVIIANLQIDMKLISAPVERGDEAVLQAGREETTSWSAASPRRQQFEKLVFWFFVSTPRDTLCNGMKGGYINLWTTQDRFFKFETIMSIKIIHKISFRQQNYR